MINKVKEYFNNLTEKEINSIVYATKVSNKSLHYLKEKLEIARSTNNLKNTVGFIINALRENFMPSTKDIYNENTSNNYRKYIHTRHHDIEQTWSKYSDKELE